MKRSSRLLASTAWIFYFVIVFEFLFMITPFALYFYSAFRPAIHWLNSNPYTSWLTAFFLPHFAQTDSLLLNGLRTAGWCLALLGLAVFLVSAAQLYTSQLMRKGAVTGLLYRYVRHPQYLGLAVLGLGVTLIWPRFLALLTFVTMLFVYRWLAAVEEARCIGKFGDSYERYVESTGAFLPRIRLPGDVSYLRRLADAAPYSSLATYVVVMVLAAGAAFALREHMLSSVSADYRENLVILSPAKLSRDELSSTFSVASSEPSVRSIVGEHSVPLLVYVVPAEWYLPDLPIDAHEIVRKQGGHATPTDFDRSKYRVLLMGVKSHAESPQRRDIVRTAYSREPLLIADVDMEAAAVTGIADPPPSVIWGEIAAPLM